MNLVVIRSQKHIYLLKEVVTETRYRAVVRAFQFEPYDLGPGEAPSTILTMLDNLRVKRQYALNRSGFAGTTHTHKRKSLGWNARRGTKYRILSYQVELSLCLRPETKIKRISSYISCSNQPRKTLFQFKVDV